MLGGWSTRFLAVAVVLVGGCTVMTEPVEQYAWQLPSWLPPPLVPANNPMSREKVALGKKLFNDFRLSLNGTTSCASCHRSELAFTDARARSIGADGMQHQRNAMSLINVAYAPRYGWADSSIDSLEAQTRKVFYNTQPMEMGWMEHQQEIIERVAADPRLGAEFRVAFPEDEPAVNERNITRAIASYMRTLISTDSAYDRWVYQDDSDALTEVERRGMRLFFSKRLGCAGCHSGFNFSGPVAAAGSKMPAAQYANTGLGGDNDQGLAEVTGRRADRGRFRVPTLRNLASTAPYMHDGRFNSLPAVIDHYSQIGGSPSPNLDPRLELFQLTSAEKNALIEFLAVL